MKKGIIVIFIFFCLFSNGYTASKSNSLTESQVRQIVKDEIKKNPQLIYSVLTTYIQKEREKKELAMAFRHRISGIPIYSYNPSKGSHNAPITIIEFTDFQCPFCRRASHTINELTKLYPDKIRLVFKNLPLSSMHKESLPAAKAAMAANKQGMFWPYYDMLFEHSSVFNEKFYVNIAKTLQLDIDKFRHDMKSREVKKEIQTDIKTAKKFGINATPVFIINGVLIKGARPLDFFKKVIDLLLKENRFQEK